MQTHIPSQQPVGRPAWLVACFWASTAIALAVVLRRLLALLRPSTGGTPQLAALEHSFSSHTALTLAHIVPAAIFVILAAVLLLRRSTNPWLERAFFLFGAITGLTAYRMSTFAFGGTVELAAVLVFNSWFLFSLARAYFHHEPSLRREWMTRAVAILLGIATTRPVMAIFFATSLATHLQPNQFFGWAFWIGFALNALCIELWLHSRRYAATHH